MAINQAISGGGSNANLTYTNTPFLDAVRTISVPRSVADLLAVELVGKGPDDVVFETPRGGVLREGNWRRDVFDAAAVKVGLGRVVKGAKGDRYEGITPHALRHTAASLAISAGAHVVAVARLLGHASPNVTLGVYAHLFENDLDDVATRLDAAAEVSRTNRGPNVVALDSERERRTS